MNLELNYAEDFTLNSALMFLLGQPWNIDHDICHLAENEGLDGDLIWLTTRVLFGPATVHLATGQAV